MYETAGFRLKFFEKSMLAPEKLEICQAAFSCCKMGPDRVIRCAEFNGDLRFQFQRDLNIEYTVIIPSLCCRMSEDFKNINKVSSDLFEIEI
jgi:hypothetical protein